MLIQKSMKYALVIILLFTCAALQAQKWHFGPRFDLTFNNVKGKGIGNGFTLGFQAGGFAQYEISRKWNLQPELFYSQRTVKKAANFMVYYNVNGRSTAITDMQLNYISLPLLVRFNLSEKFSFLAGPQYSYLFNADENLLRTNKDAFKKQEISMAIGAQFNISNVAFSVRYNPLLYNINNIDDRYKWKSDCIQIGFAVKIR